jgi:hypothetical protein
MLAPGKYLWDPVGGSGDRAGLLPPIDPASRGAGARGVWPRRARGPAAINPLDRSRQWSERAGQGPAGHRALRAQGGSQTKMGQPSWWGKEADLGAEPVAQSQSCATIGARRLEEQAGLEEQAQQL